MEKKFPASGTNPLTPTLSPKGRGNILNNFPSPFVRRGTDPSSVLWRRRRPLARQLKGGVEGPQFLITLTAFLSIVFFAAFCGCEKEAVGKSDAPTVKTSEGLTAQAEDPAPLNTADRKELLQIARNAVETFITTGKTPAVSNPSPAILKKLGSFVTLKKGGSLRGCIGRFEPDIPLYQVVSEMAIAAATQDFRFSRVNKDELPQLEYEISVLSPLKKVPNADGIIAGTHGVQVRKGFRGGVFLPQVATEHHLDKESFLSLLCAEKAGLPANCWKDPDTDLSVFTAQVFNEKELEGNQAVGNAQ